MRALGDVVAFDRRSRRHTAADDEMAGRQVPELVADLSTGGQDAARRGRMMAVLAHALRRGAGVAGQGARIGGGRLADELLAVAPKLPVRDAATLRAQYPGLGREELAERLIAGAVRASGAVGGVVGAWAVLPVVPAFAVEVAAETLAVVAVEVKLVAELHEVYGQRAPGAGPSRMTAYVAAWAQRRGVTPSANSLALAVGSPLRRRLQRRLMVRAGRSTVALGPLLTGAAAGAVLNRRETRRLGNRIRMELRERAQGDDGAAS